MTNCSPCTAHTLPTQPWPDRWLAALRTAWVRLLAFEAGERERYLAQASSHADLETRIRHWERAERHPWLPPR
jgi:hypothetical protein